MTADERIAELEQELELTRRLLNATANMANSSFALWLTLPQKPKAPSAWLTVAGVLILACASFYADGESECRWQNPQAVVE